MNNILLISLTVYCALLTRSLIRSRLARRGHDQHIHYLVDSGRTEIDAAYKQGITDAALLFKDMPATQLHTYIPTLRVWHKQGYWSHVHQLDYTDTYTDTPDNIVPMYVYDDEDMLIQQSTYTG